MTKQNDALFEESSQGAVSAVTAVVLILSIALGFGGLVVMSYAFGSEHSELMSFGIFSGGLLATVLGFAIPFNLLPSSGR